MGEGCVRTAAFETRRHPQRTLVRVKLRALGVNSRLEKRRYTLILVVCLVAVHRFQRANAYLMLLLMVCSEVLTRCEVVPR